MENTKLFTDLAEAVLRLGAFKAKVIDTSDISLDKSFRDMCASNACGAYGKCWMCPPDIGDIETLMAEIANYKYALVYQTVSDLEDSFDFEGMIDAKKQSYKLAQNIRGVFALPQIGTVLHLGAGGCGVCKVCAKKTNEPCRHPDLAMPSLEAYGVNVSKLATAADMKYVNGQDTVTYFAAVLFNTER